MIANRELGVDDYLAIARRRLALVLVPGLVAPLLAFLVSFALKPKYTSVAVLLVEGQLLPDGYVKPIVTEHVSDRMTTVEQNVLSRSRLQPLVEQLGLVRKGQSLDSVVDQIRSGVSVTETSLGKPHGPFEKTGPGGTADVAGFNVNYTSDNPRDAQQVCAEITSLILAENLEVREQVAKSTTEFLSRQLEQAKRNLDEMDTKVAQFKIQHFGRMPGDMETNFRLLAAMNSQLDASTQAISRMQENKLHTQAQLDKELDAWKSAQAAPTFAPLRQQLVSLQEHLVLLQTRYTDDFPDVGKTKREIEALQAKLKEMNSEAEGSDSLREATVPRGGAKLEPASISQLREQIYRSDKAIERATEGQKRMGDRIDAFQRRFNADPEVEEEWKQLNRDSGTAHSIYDQLLTNRSTAEIQTEMERNQEGEQLKLLDPASLPGAPSFPVRWKFALYGLGGGLAIGLCVGLLLEFQDKAIRNEGDVLAALELPMLASVPWVGESNGKSWKNRFGRPSAMQLKEGKTG